MQICNKSVQKVQMIRGESVGLSSGGQVVIIVIHTNETTFLITTQHEKLDVFFLFDLL